MFTGIAADISYTIGAIVSIGAIAYFIAQWRSGRSNTKNVIQNQAMHELEITVGALEKQNKLQASQIQSGDNDRKVLATKVAELTGKVDTLSTIPLDKIEKHMADTNNILKLVLPLIQKLNKETI